MIHGPRPHGVAKAILFTGLFLPSVTAGMEKTLGSEGINVDDELVHVLLIPAGFTHSWKRQRFPNFEKKHSHLVKLCFVTV